MSATSLKALNMERIELEREREGEKEHWLSSAFLMPRFPIPKIAKMCSFSCGNGIDYDFLDKLNVGNLSESPKYVENRTIKRERGRKITFAELCILDA